MYEQSFYKFAQLPTEVRHLIWHHALDNATAGRIIHVSLMFCKHLTGHHRCLSSDLQGFCGSRGLCAARERRSEHSKSSTCMSDGFFYSTIWFPEPETAHTATGMFDMSLSCHEARHILVGRYPNTMRVYQEPFQPGIKSRLVRCNPVTDMLVITCIHQHRLSYLLRTTPHAEKQRLGMQTTKYHRTYYPEDPKLFAEFRHLISSWENVAFYYAGRPPLVTDPARYNEQTKSWPPNTHLLDCDPEDFEPFREIEKRPSDNMSRDRLFQEFVPYLQSLKRLVAWPHPKYWPELRKDAIVIDDMEDIAFPRGVKMPKHVKVLVKDTRRFLREYSVEMKLHNAVFLDSDEHWSVKAKPVTRVGSYVAPLWVAGDKQTEYGYADESESEDSEYDSEYDE